MTQHDIAKRGKATIKDVADHAGVSKAAVSKVLRNAYGVSDEMRAKVLQSITDLGYRPSTAARGMRGQTYVIGILLVEIGNPFLPEVVQGLQEALAPAGYKALIGVGGARRRIEAPMIDSMIDMQLDGIVLVAPRLSGAELEHYARQVPMVVLGHHEPEAKGFDTVNSNDRLGARIATEALLETGREVVMLSLPLLPDDEANVYVEREAGYHEAMAAAGRTARVTRVRNWPDDEEPDILETIEIGSDPIAVFCWSDLHAVKLVNAVRMAGLRVPEDVAIIGYDDTPIAAMPLISLTSIDQKAQELGQIAARTLLGRVEGRTVPEHIQLDPMLARRDSL